MLHTQAHGYNENVSNDLKIQIRIGISGGETMTVTHYDGKTEARWGWDMILAKRIMGKGAANHILVSEQVVLQVRQLHKGYKFIDMGNKLLNMEKNKDVFISLPR
jgi:class 3 adenylate cyclase